MSKENKKYKDKRKFWVRLVCVFLAVLMAGSSILYVLGALFGLV